MHFAKELSAVIKWSSFLGLLPWYSSKMRCFVPNRGYTLLVHFILVLMYLSVIWEAVEFNNGLFLQISYLSLILVSALVQNVKLSIWNVDDLNRLFYEMDHLDLELEQRFLVPKHTTTIFVTVHVLSALACFSSMFSWGPTLHVLLMTLSTAFFEYFFAAQIILQLFILRGICKRSWLVSHVVRGYSQQKHFQSDFVANVALLQRKVSRIADIFNKLFGWNTFLHILLIFVSILYLVYIYINLHGSTEATKYLLPYSIELFLQSLQILVLSKQGQAVCKDSDAIASFCCDLISSPAKDQNQNRVRDLLQQVSLKQARISAAGFFEVNYPMLFLLFNLLITYVIALVQLMPN